MPQPTALVRFADAEPDPIGHHEAMHAALEEADRDKNRKLAILETALNQNIGAGTNTDHVVMALEGRVSELEARPKAAAGDYSFGRDLLERLTSRVFLAFVAGLGLLIGAAISGAIAWDDAFSKLVWLIGIFSGVEGIRDVSTNLRGHKPAPAPPSTPPHTD